MLWLWTVEARARRERVRARRENVCGAAMMRRLSFSVSVESRGSEKTERGDEVKLNEVKPMVKG